MENWFFFIPPPNKNNLFSQDSSYLNLLGKTLFCQVKGGGLYVYVVVYLKYSDRESISKAFSCVWGFSNIAPSAT